MIRLFHLIYHYHNDNHSFIFGQTCNKIHWKFFPMLPCWTWIPSASLPNHAWTVELFGRAGAALLSSPTVREYPDSTAGIVPEGHHWETAFWQHPRRAVCQVANWGLAHRASQAPLENGWTPRLARSLCPGPHQLWRDLTTDEDKI